MNYTLKNQKTPQWFIIIWIIVLLIFIIFKAFGQERKELPELNQKILHYIDSVKGSKVGNGICITFVKEALWEVGAHYQAFKPSIAFGLPGKKITLYGKPIKEEEAIPGDIVTTLGHVGIIYKRTGEYTYLIAHQNINPTYADPMFRCKRRDRKVIITDFNTDTYTWGIYFAFFRPFALPTIIYGPAHEKYKKINIY